MDGGGVSGTGGFELRLLGPVEAYGAGRPLAVGPRKQRLLLAILALEVNRSVPVDRLVELMWTQAPPRTAEHAVRVGVSRLRGALDPTTAAFDGRCDRPRIVASAGGYRLDADPMTIDAHRFRSLVGQARLAGTDPERIRLLDGALALWRGPALSGSWASTRR
jgi:ABC-2 type transport system ATP-binding protein